MSSKQEASPLSLIFPSTLRRASHWCRIVDGTVPIVVMRPENRTADPLPFLLWFHGRTVTKEIDSGRYLRLIRAGIGCVAVDLPGHGERLDLAMHDGARTLDVVQQAAGEVDSILRNLEEFGFDMRRAVIGGMSAGGMAAILRGCAAHPFCGMLLEATTGDWESQRSRPMYQPDVVARLNPIAHLSDWRDIPLLALHSELDEWVAIEGQRKFVDAVRAHSSQPQKIELHAYPSTGAPYEHMGFGRMAADAKQRTTEFVAKCVGMNF
ncbi:MAG: alpha/beta fold hydrolase [Planctomycetota bacterium]|nr:alpha/beta fold hydrolase [Planctomycetota bacterium]MDA1262863.1 alpha/beta fold hydrolase [Planctomycetota bacterium]